jgi:hypothetical protein
MAVRQWLKEGSPSTAGLQVPRRILGRRSTALTRRPKMFGVAAAASGVVGVEEDGGAPLRAAMVPAMRLGRASVEDPARPGNMVAAVKERTVVGPA